MADFFDDRDTGRQTLPMRGSRLALVEGFEGGRLGIGAVEELVAGVVIRREQLRHFIPQLSIRRRKFREGTRRVAQDQGRERR